MVRRLVLEPAGVAVVVGQAGTGKTFALGAAREAWEASGRRVLGAALARRAARELEEGAGIPSTSVTALLEELRRRPLSTLGRGAVLVIDEAAHGADARARGGGRAGPCGGGEARAGRRPSAAAGARSGWRVPRAADARAGDRADREPPAGGRVGARGARAGPLRRGRRRGPLVRAARAGRERRGRCRASPASGRRLVGGERSRRRVDDRPPARRRRRSQRPRARAHACGGRARSGRAARRRRRLLRRRPRRAAAQRARR